jgi:hypothetical protein
VDAVPPRAQAAAAQVGGSGEEAGDGSWQMCLTDGTLLEGPGLCHWSADRTQVLWIAGEDVPGLGAFAGPFLSFEEEPDVLVIDRSDDEDVIAGYRPTAGSAISVNGTPDRAGGLASFSGLRLHDPATGEPVRPGWRGPEALSIDGVLRWSCGSPPPFSDGWGPGAIRVQIDEPAGDLTWQASCWWGLADRGGGQRVPVVSAVDGDFVPAGEQEIAIQITPLDERQPFALTATATRAQQTRSSTYTAGEQPAQFSEFRPDGSAGQLRFTGWRRLRPMEGDPEEPLGGPGGPFVIDGTVDWQCGEPRGALVEIDPTAPPP